MAKTVLITGCTPGGIGHALCLEYHKKGLSVIATARRPEVLQGLKAAGLTTLELDVTSSESIKRCSDQVHQITSGKLDILINNAGVPQTYPATDLEIPEVQKLFETNVFGSMAMVAAFAKQLIAAKGLIINIASLSAYTPFLFGSVYAASKGAIISYSRVLRLELLPFNVRVMCAVTGTVKSNIQRHTELPEDSLYKPVQDIFEWRQAYSQESNPIPTAQYASKLVEASLRPESSPILRRWFGRPDWFWYGGSSSFIWFAHSLGEWAVDFVCYHTFKVAEITKRLAGVTVREN